MDHWSGGREPGSGGGWPVRGAVWLRIVEITVVLVLMAAALCVTLFTASAVRGQSAPRTPAAPSAPGAPATPPSPNAPPDPAGAVSGSTQDMSLALLLLNTRDRHPGSVVTGLGQTFVSVSGHRLARPDADRLASALTHALRGRDLVHVATGSITHGYLEIAGRGTAGRLVPFDGEVLAALGGGS